jgi:hypothetical protein
MENDRDKCQECHGGPLGVIDTDVGRELVECNNCGAQCWRDTGSIFEEPKEPDPNATPEWSPA